MTQLDTLPGRRYYALTPSERRFRIERLERDIKAADDELQDMRPTVGGYCRHEDYVGRVNEARINKLQLIAELDHYQQQAKEMGL